MKVCFVSPYGYPLFNPNIKATHGGAEMDLFLIGTALATRKNFEVSYVVADFGQRESENYQGIRVWKSFRTDKTGIFKIVYGVICIPLRLLHALRKANANIYVQEGAGLESAIVALYCLLTRKKFVYRVASTIECNGAFTKIFPIIGRIFQWALYRANAIVTEDREEVELLQKHFGLRSQAIYDTTPLPDESSIIPAQHRKIILWVSRLVPMKRPEVFIQLAHAFPQEQFVLVAPSDAQHKNFAQHILTLAQSAPNVSFIPGLPHQDLDGYYQKAKIFVNTSDFEGYPNTFLEAGKYGVPILSLNVNPDGLLTKGRFGECANGSFEQLKTLVKEWLGNETRREMVGKKLSVYVRETSDINKNILAYEKLFALVTSG